LSKAKAEALAARGLKILTPSRRNMKNKPIQTEEEKQLLCEDIVETVMINSKFKTPSGNDHIIWYHGCCSGLLFEPQ
jgi:hypothetical protein